MQKERCRGGRRRWVEPMLWRVQGVVSAHAGVPGRLWACTGLANASLSRARAVHGDDQQGRGKLLDTFKVNGEDQRERWHDGRHEHRMVRVWLSPGFNHHWLVLGLMQEMQRINDHHKTKVV